ncbi:MAG: formylglycine-generating enzyme family protein [Planctomycetes bacterium]|nr:formylglycine-generating enzyme family protein [Planctomycetota bacterium]
MRSKFIDGVTGARRLNLFLSILIIGAIFLIPACPGGYTVSGKVVEIESDVEIGVVDVTVTVVNEDGTKESYSDSTDEFGEFIVDGVICGTYIVTPEKDGYTFDPEYMEIEVNADVEGLVFEAVETASDMAQIPAGCFDMGDTDGYSDEERPVHQVCLSAFEMDYHEITNAEYAECVSDGECTAPGNSDSNSRSPYYDNPDYDDYPVIYVNWYQVSAYCTWADKRLPTEAEWEYAARGGLAGNQYPWGDTVDIPNGGEANYYYAGDLWGHDTSPVGYYAPNGYELYDMAGNVWEWVEDDYHSDYDLAPVDGSAWVDSPVRGATRILRGGYWGSSEYELRVAFRSNNDSPDDNAPDYSASGRRGGRSVR